ncbi:MAG: hypothetical protein R3E10_04210 [Gemmatimonadota bacterium]
MRNRALPLLSLAAALAAGPAEAQDAARLIQDALDRNDSRTETVYNYTVVHRFLGLTSESYFERADVDGRWVFVPRITATDLADQRLRQDRTGHLGISAWADPFGHLQRWASSATVEGTEVIDGVVNWVIRIDDFGGSEWGLTPGTYADGVFRPSVGRLYLDRRNLLVQRFDVTGSYLQQDGAARPVRMLALLQDYRTIEGLTHPFRLEIEVHGLGAPSDAERTATQLLADLQAQMATLGEQDRALVEDVVRQQVERLQRELGGDAPMRLVVDVQEIRVNQGPPRE